MIWFVLFLQKYEISWFAVSLQRFFDAFSGSFTHNGGYFFQARLFDTGNTLEGFEQGCFPLFSYTFDVVEGGSYLTLAPFVPMERNGKTVHFILYIFQQVEQGSPLLDTEYYRGGIRKVPPKSYDGCSWPIPQSEYSGATRLR